MSSATQPNQEDHTKYLNGAELREEICHMAEVEKDSKFGSEFNDGSRGFVQRERIGIIMYLVSDHSFDLSESFVKEAIKDHLYRSNGKTQNQILDQVADLGMETYGNGQNGAKKLLRDELKALYKYLEAYNDES